MMNVTSANLFDKKREEKKCLEQNPSRKKKLKKWTQTDHWLFYFTNHKQYNSMALKKYLIWCVDAAEEAK